MTRRPHVVITVVLTCAVSGLLSGCGTGQSGSAERSAGSPSDRTSSPGTTAGGTRAVAIYYVSNAARLACVSIANSARGRQRTR